MGQASATSSAPAAPSMTIPNAPSATSVAPPAMTEDPENVRLLRSFFAGYVDGTDFAFLEAFCAPRLDRFLTMKNADVAAVIASAKKFFADKRGVAYKAEFGAMRVERRAEGTLAKLPVVMSWDFPAPKEWGTEWPLAAATDGVPRIDRTVTVDVEVLVDSSNRIQSYVETRVHAPALITDDRHRVLRRAGADAGVVSKHRHRPGGVRGRAASQERHRGVRPRRDDHRLRAVQGSNARAPRSRPRREVRLAGRQRWLRGSSHRPREMHGHRGGDCPVHERDRRGLERLPAAVGRRRDVRTAQGPPTLEMRAARRRLHAPTFT